MASRKQLLVTTLIALFLFAATSYAIGIPHKPKFDRCFPAKLWDGEENHPDSVRPCVRIKRVYEDGSVVIGIYDANGTERYDFAQGALDR